MLKEELECAIRKVQFKDASTQIMGPYCTPCVQYRLDILAEEMRQKSPIIFDSDRLIDSPTGELIGRYGGIGFRPYKR